MSEKLPTVLIVDDSATTRAMITRVIQMTGVAVGSIMEASNGREALDRMEQCQVHIVLADLNMPVMDGVAMISEMRRKDALRNIPVVVISAQPDTDLMEQLKSSGVSGYLPKPFTPESAREMLGPILEEIGRTLQRAVPLSTGAFNLNLAEALAEALETMAFISPEMVEPADLQVQADKRITRVAFCGKGFRGSLSLEAPRQFGEAVARNFAVSDAKAQADDALKELTNVTCGLFLRKRTGGAVGFASRSSG